MKLITSTSLFAAVLAASPAISAQALVSYGDHRAGVIASAGQSDRYFLLGAQTGDIMLITFVSDYWGSCNCSIHQLEITDGTTVVGSVVGRGPLISTLSSNATLTVTVRARNNQWTGSYAFQVNRLNDPVGAERLAMNWKLTGSITAAAQYAARTIRAESGSTAVLQHTSPYQGSCNCYLVNAELFDSSGSPVATVTGNGSTSVTFQSTGIYTLVVSGRSYDATGWYVTSLDCASSPGTPCDSLAQSHGYCVGLAGTNGVPSLTARTAPRLGTTTLIDIGNSAGVQTQAWLLFGIAGARQSTPFGGMLCVSAPVFLPPVNLPVQGLGVPVSIPNHPLLMGMGFAFQSLVADAGAPQQLAFSRGLMLIAGQ